MNKKYFASIAALMAILILGFGIFKFRQYYYFAGGLKALFEKAKKYESGIIQKVPIYDDYRSAQIETELRSHLLKDHLAVAQKTKSEQVKGQNEISLLLKTGELVNIDAKRGDLYYFYNVPKEFRFLRKFTHEGIKLINETFEKKLREYIPELDLDSKVKIAISSALRPSQYQNNLRNKNQNAAFESTHSYGISFDVFYDEYYVSIVPESLGNRSNPDMEKMKRQFGLTLGASLRRQFHSILSDTLLELQRQGKLYAIWESNQRCYHITILPGTDNSAK